MSDSVFDDACHLFENRANNAVQGQYNDVHSQQYCQFLSNCIMFELMINCQTSGIYSLAREGRRGVTRG